MALKVLMLRKKIDDKKKAMNALIEKDSELEKREAELEKSIAEAQTEEETKFLDEEIAKHEADKQAQADAKAQLEREISDMEQELGEEEAEQDVDAPAPAEEPKKEERKNQIIMSKKNLFANMSMTERDAFFGRDDIKNWLGEVRTAMKEHRALSNVGLTIPEVILPILRENIINWSKLYDRVNVQRVNGEGRQVVMGTIPEAVWTECCGNLNELDLGFNDWTMDCYKVAGFFAVCNANLEDSDIDLANEILTALGYALGKALDKAILYGRNTANALNMPQGIISSLLQESQPAGYPSSARAWADYHSTHVIAVGTAGSPLSGQNLFKGIVEASAVADGAYARGEQTFVMNEKTYKYLLAQSMGIDASGALVAGMNGRMPVVGGDAVVLNFMPDKVIAFGYFDLYTLAERAGRQFAQSEHYLFTQDKTVFKATARYDGAPIIREAFGIISINGASVSATAVTFNADDANSVLSLRISAPSASVAVGATKQLIAITEPGEGTVTWASATTAKATVSSTGLVTGVASGSSVITATCNGLTDSCTVTVTA